MPDEIVIVDAARTPLSPAGQPSPLDSLSEIDLLNELAAGVMDRAGIDTPCIDEVHGAGIRTDCALESSRFWGFDILYSASSSLGALFTAVQGIQADPRGVALVAAVNHDTAATALHPLPARSHPVRTNDPRVNAELLVGLHGLTRADVDDYARQSFERAHECACSGDYKREIVPIASHYPPGHITVMCADKLRQTPDLAALDPSPWAIPDGDEQFSDTGVTTMGNSAQPAHGAAAALITSLRRANELGLTPRARIRQFTELYRRPGQRYCNLASLATRSVLSECARPATSMDHVEIPDTFAATAVAWQSEFQINPDLLNPRGGAMPLGDLSHAAGLRSLATMLGALEDTGGKYGLIIGAETSDICHGLIIEQY
ncbi:hypothetical protein ACGF5S_32910 [Nocardia nova]|uniref:thiolase family protein n=1 Tax=Nocardia nova TaxID=37330 RepID=UPI00371CC190